jgi:TPR repeat protein
VPKPAPKEKAEPAVKIDMDEFRKFLEMEKTEKIKESPAPVKTEEPVKPIAEEAPKKEEILVPDISEDRLFFTGLESYKARMMDYAFAYLKKSAEKGYEPAYYHLGKMYYAGEGTKIDCEKAYFWLKKSAEEKFEPALCLCAEMILCGHLGEGKEKEAVEYLDTAISGGSTKAKELESRFYYVCDKIHREKKAEEEAKAAEKLKANLAAREEIKKKRREYRIYLDGALSGDSRAMLELADICEEEGNDCYSEEKLFEAFFWAVFAAEEGNHMAIKKVGEMLENGTGVPVHFGKAIEWYSKTPYAMTERDILAMDVKSGCLEEIPDPESYEDFIATCSVEGEGLCELAFSYEEKLEGFMKLFVAAALGDPDAQYGLGKIYYNGFDFADPNPAKAKHWLAKAANNKNSDALEFLRKIR